MQIVNSNIISSDPWYKEWRLIGAYVFYTICLFDFVLAPLITILLSVWFKSNLSPWVTLTTQGGGLFYFAFGGILGISAWGKFSENKEIIKIGQSESSAD